jgi:hypothetical protein
LGGQGWFLKEKKIAGQFGKWNICLPQWMFCFLKCPCEQMEEKIYRIWSSPSAPEKMA